jgi:hypothetical protein
MPQLTRKSPAADQQVKSPQSTRNASTGECRLATAAELLTISSRNQIPERCHSINIPYPVEFVRDTLSSGILQHQSLMQIRRPQFRQCVVNRSAAKHSDAGYRHRLVKNAHESAPMPRKPARGRNTRVDPATAATRPRVVRWPRSWRDEPRRWTNSRNP